MSSVPDSARLISSSDESRRIPLPVRSEERWAVACVGMTVWRQNCRSLSHCRQVCPQAKLDAYHLRLFSHFLERLASTPDGDGSLLDHRVILCKPGMSDSNLHLSPNLALVGMGGGAGQIASGRHLRFPQVTPVTNLQHTLIEKMGVPMDTFGDSTGKLNLPSNV